MRWPFRLLSWLLVASLSLAVCAELYLRYRGEKVYDPADYFSRANQEVGWVPPPGKVLSQDCHPDNPVYESVWPDTSRVSRPEWNRQTKYRVLVTGCSYTYGMGLRDDETFVWRLNQRFKDITFDNFGVYGYGTYLCYLRQKQQLERHHHKYDLVLYVNFNDHLRRNYPGVVGVTNNLDFYGLAPGVTLSKQGKLTAYGGECRWPYDGVLVSVNFLKRLNMARFVNKVRAHVNEGSDLECQYAIMALIMQQMYNQAKAYGAEFAAVALENGGLGYYVPVRPLFEEKGWHDYNVNLPEAFPFQTFYATDGLEGHPNDASMHCAHDMKFHFGEPVQRSWAKHIGDWLEANRAAYFH